MIKIVFFRTALHFRSFGSALLLCGVVLTSLFCFFCGDNPVAPKPLTIATYADSVVIIHDTLTIRVSVPDAEVRGVRYLWSIEHLMDPDTTRDSVLTWICSPADTGSHIALIKALARDGTLSATDTMRFRVTYRKPTLALQAGAQGWVGVPYTVRFMAQKGISAIERLFWYRNDPHTVKATIDTSLSWTWNKADTGIQRIVAWAMDRDSLLSEPDSIIVTVSATRPVMLPLRDTSVKINDTLMLTLSAYDSLLPVTGYTYYIDSADSVTSTNSATLTMFWRRADTGIHRLVVCAMNSALLNSLPDTALITVTCHHPQLRLLADSFAGIYDTCIFIAEAGDSDGTVLEYEWSIDNAAWFITRTPILSWRFAGNMAGMHTVRAIAVDNDGLISDTVTAVVRTTLMRPTVTLQPTDTTVSADVSIVIRAFPFDSNGSISEFKWSLDGSAVSQSIFSDSITLTFPISDTGMHLVTCSVVDNHALESLPDSTTIHVFPGIPFIQAMNDTTVSSLDSLLLTCTAADSGGSIVRYLWDTRGTGWSDTTTEPHFLLGYADRQSVRVLVAAQDNDGFIAVDTIVVTFNRPPDSIVIHSPAIPGDTCTLSLLAPVHELLFDFQSQDPDSDTVLYAVGWGTAADMVTPVYEGYDETYTLSLANEGVYYWRVSARDSWGNVSERTGKYVALREYRICFMGHSIVAGLYGDDVVGGFRGIVLDSLRSGLPPTSRLRAVGPATTPHMSRSTVDDSCLAVSGITARENYLLLTSGASSLKPDIWVFMIGANDAFVNNSCRLYTTMIIDEMIHRNPTARIYVCNSPPLSSGFTTHNAYLPGFNQFLADTVAARASQGIAMFLVNAFGALTINDQYNQEWYNTDGIHPNQTGYNRLADTIISVMRGSDPPAIPTGP